MVAPNGARRRKKDHANIPLNIDEIVRTAVACQAAGADGVHLHIRNTDGGHSLNVETYLDLLKKIEPEIPGMYLQVTSESAGIYAAPEQQAVVRGLRPDHVSVAFREMVRCEDDWPAATQFYQWATSQSVDIQHIIYSLEELELFLTAISSKLIPAQHHLLQFVLGSYDGTKVSDPSQIELFTDLLSTAPSELTFDWMLCAFGVEETSCLVEAINLGGKARIGFENSLWNADGSIAKSNEERVSELVSYL